MNAGIVRPAAVHHACRPIFSAVVPVSARHGPALSLIAGFSSSRRTAKDTTGGPNAVTPTPDNTSKVPAKPRPAKSRLRKTAVGGTLDLEHFVQRGRVLALYRTIVRSLNRSRLDPGSRKESLAFARSEFERNKHTTDISHIRYLISTGKTEWEAIQRSVEQ
ncbi:hypothetical protein BROUX41_000833 [Berkeleyomyces rouxiae]|uniref:uncharacterized protein n=1 Tax=Berkeleyomyces rouxiae TaxID=2035830 RepID=UPI003B790C92